MYICIGVLEYGNNISKLKYRLKSLEEEHATGYLQEEGDGENGISQDTTQVRMAPPDPKFPCLPLSSEFEVTEIPNLLASAITFPSVKNDNKDFDTLDDGQDELVELDEKGEEVINSNNNLSNSIQEKDNGNLVF